MPRGQARSARGELWGEWRQGCLSVPGTPGTPAIVTQKNELWPEDISMHCNAQIIRHWAFWNVPGCSMCLERATHHSGIFISFFQEL